MQSFGVRAPRLPCSRIAAPTPRSRVRTSPTPPTSSACSSNVAAWEQPESQNRQAVVGVFIQAVGSIHELLTVSLPAWLAAKQAAAAQYITEETGKLDVKGLVKTARMHSVVLPFAASAFGKKSSEELFLMLNQAVYQFVSLYLLFLFLRVILSWFPAFDWERFGWRQLRQITDPYLNIFTGIVPPLLGAIDLTPLIGFFVLQALQGYLTVYDEDDIECWW